MSAALFGQVEWHVSDRLRLLPGLRLNYDEKFVDFDQQVYGGLQTTDPVLLALKSVNPCAADLHGRCRRRQLSGAAHAALKCRRRLARMQRMRPASNP